MNPSVPCVKCHTLLSLPYILDRRAPVSFLSPDFEGGNQQNDELSVLHADGHHVSLRTVTDGACWVAQVHLIQHLLFPHEAMQDQHILVINIIL